jgi:ribosomal protein S12 methylthiotransferase accessory factor
LPAFGVTRVANLTGLDRIGLPVVMVCRPNARSSAVFHGKGLDLAAAKASGVMEAIETWHAENVQRPLRFGSAAELQATCSLIDLEALPRARDNVFRRELPLVWIEGRDLIGGDSVWLPFEIVHANSAIPGPPSSGCFAASTNGLASGNHPMEAVSHALCEVIERDAMSLWHHLHPRLRDETRLDRQTVADEACRRVIDQLERTGFDLAVWDITTDIGVPVFHCVTVDLTGETGHVGYGAGCHPSREIALLRAVTEAVQVRTTYIAGSREDIEHADYRPATLNARVSRLCALMRPAGRMRDFAAIDHFEFPTFATEVAWLLDRLKAAGIRQAVAVDLTRPEFGIPVVRVVVPGLEGSDSNPAYVPGARARAAAQRLP